MFRLPRTAYLAVLFVLLGVLPFALGSGVSGGEAGGVSASPLIALFLLPVAVGGYVARTATIVDAAGITVRALFGQRLMRWSQLRGVSVQGSAVYAVLDDGSVRLPCVQLRSLTALARAGGDHLPQLRQPVYKQPPVQRRR